MQTFRINSDISSLDDIGISYNINGLNGTLKKIYPSGWMMLTVTHNVDGMEFTNDFDLPKYMLQEIL